MPPLNILVLEDNPLDTELMLRELHRAGLEPEWLRVDNEKDYLSHLHAGLDLILSDYQMPQFNGLRALELLRERGWDIPFILISGTIGEETAVEAMRQGATDYLLKDRLSRLGTSIQHALEESHLRKERKAATEKLRLRETALNAVSQGVLISDENRLIIYANTSFTELSGYAESEVLGRNCAFLQGPDTDPETVLKIRAALTSGKPFEGEILNYRKDGESFWNELSIALIRGEEGGRLRFIGIQRDITARKRSEEALRRKETELRVLFDLMPAMIWFKDTKNNHLRVNERVAVSVGRPVGEIEGKPCSYIYPKEAAGFYAADLEVIRSGVPKLGIIESIRDREGVERWIQTDKVPYRDKDGAVIGIVVMAQDITERKETQQALSVALERLQIAVKAGKAGTWDLDLLTGTVDWDEQMLTLYGKNADNVEPGTERWFRAIHPDDLEHLQATHETALKANRDSFDTEFRIVRHDDGSLRFIRAMGVVLRNESGEPVRMTGINLDVTEQRSREEKLATALAHEKELSEKARAGDRAKSEFLAVMSHEVRTPMNGIMGFAGLLLQAPLSPECHAYALTIVQSGEALTHVLDDILDFSRLEAGGLKVTSEVFAPRVLLQDILRLMAHQATEKDVKVHLFVADSIPDHLQGDAGRLRQILLNIIGNAIKFTQRGTIGITLKPLLEQPSTFVFAIKDTGVGIPPEQIGRIFQPFTQADSSISRKYGGTGLGLTISRRLAELLGGELSVKSQPGTGSEFFVTLPLAVAHEPLEAPSAAPPESLDASFATRHPLRLLVVEDDGVNLKLIKVLLRRLGYAPLSAKNGREAVTISGRENLDCILMDLQMPEMDGIEASLAIRSLEKNRDRAPVFISALTANIFPADRQRCFEAGMEAYLNKPVKIAALAETLAKACDARARLVSPAGYTECP